MIQARIGDLTLTTKQVGIMIISKFKLSYVSPLSFAIDIPENINILELSVDRKGTWEYSVKTICNILEKINIFSSFGFTIYLWRKKSFINLPIMQMKQGLWHEREIKFDIGDNSYTADHKINDSNFTSGLAKINTTGLFSVLNFTRYDNTSLLENDSFLFVGKKTICYRAFDDYISANYLDISKILSFFYENDFIYIKPFGKFDDIELVVSFFGSKAMIADLYDSIQHCGLDIQ
jgi:hypothetical protein